MVRMVQAIGLSDDTEFVYCCSNCEHTISDNRLAVATESVSLNSRVLKEMLPELLPLYDGKWVIFRDRVVHAHFDDEEEAYRWGVKNLGLYGGWVLAYIDVDYGKPIPIADLGSAGAVIMETEAKKLRDERDALKEGAERLQRELSAARHGVSVYLQQLGDTADELNRLRDRAQTALAERDRARTALAEAQAEVTRLWTELSARDSTRERMASILDRTAEALKGPPADNVMHSWHDLPDLAARVRTAIALEDAHLAKLKTREERKKAAIEYHCGSGDKQSFNKARVRDLEAEKTLNDALVASRKAQVEREKREDRDE